MTQICPAILTNDIEEFERELDVYSKNFECIDIDINKEGDSFTGDVTVSTDNVVQFIKPYVKKVNFNIHLMVTNPSHEIDKFVSKYKGIPKSVSFFIHQESNINKLLDRVEELNLKLTIKPESLPRDIEFYNKFPEIQLMTVSVGQQGNPFQKNILNRAEWLRASGYSGKISIDGGVNLETAKVIREYELDRVSVGSYFSKAEDVELNKQKLNLALNM